MLGMSKVDVLKAVVFMVVAELVNLAVVPVPYCFVVAVLIGGVAAYLFPPKA